MIKVYVVEMLKQSPSFMGIYDREQIATEAHSRKDAYNRVKRAYPRKIIRYTGIVILKDQKIEDINPEDYTILK